MAAVPFALAACSDTTQDDTPRASSGVGADFGSCLREAGLDVDDPSDEEVEKGLATLPEGVDEQAYRTAARGCAEELGLSSGTSQADKERYQRHYDEVASCIREGGYEDLPAPENGNLDFSQYPRATEPEFDTLTKRCLQEFAPDTQFQDH